jgi:putative transposase
MPYWQLFYHLIWATKHREPLMAPAVAAEIHGFLRSKAIGLGATVFAVNGVADHVHLIVAIPPRIAVATFVGQIKGVASAKANKAGLTRTPFYWQEEYGAFSFDGKRLPNYIAYVERQQQHHAERTTIGVLERTEEQAEGRLIRETSVRYELGDATWRRELEALDER